MRSPIWKTILSDHLAWNTCFSWEGVEPSLLIGILKTGGQFTGHRSRAGHLYITITRKLQIYWKMRQFLHWKCGANCLHWKIRESWTVNARKTGVGLLYNATWGGRSEETLGYHRWLDKCPRRSGRLVLTSPATQQCECQRPELPNAALFPRPKIQFPYLLPNL